MPTESPRFKCIAFRMRRGASIGENGAPATTWIAFDRNEASASTDVSDDGRFVQPAAAAAANVDIVRAKAARDSSLTMRATRGLHEQRR